MSAWTFETDCVGCPDGRWIQEMVEAETQITYATMRKHLGGEEMDRWAAEMLYDTGHQRGGLRLKDDWHVSYHKSKYRGRPCLYIRHSAIEHIWVRRAS